MKIGIITYWYGEENYGQILQCHALQKFLRDRGHDAFLIKYKPQSYKIWQLRFRDFMFMWLKLLYLLNKDNLRMSMRFRNMAARPTASRHTRGFSLFRDEHIVSTDEVYDQHELYDNPPDADAYITGSDQVWRMPDSCYFLDFVPKGKTRVAYAPSFGNDCLPKVFRGTVRKYLSKFDMVTVREVSGLRICSDLGRADAKLVPDPTFLLDASQYDRLMPARIASEPYLFVYLLGNKTDFDLEHLYAWATRHKLAVKYVASCGAPDREGSIYPNVGEWLALIRDAEYVVTNSFHGMVFSILFNKHFVVLPLADEFSRMNGRLYTVAGKLGLLSRIYDGRLERLSEPIDYAVINESLISLREEIERMFLQCL